MKSLELALLCSTVSLMACQGQTEPTTWSDIQGVPEGFTDGKDDTRGDAEIRAIAQDESSKVAATLDSRLGTVDGRLATVDSQLAAVDGRLATVEAAPKYSASAASHITAEQVVAWDAQVAMGDHRRAGYLKAEQDPAFAASAASTVTTDDVTNWDKAFGWGNHASAGGLYLVLHLARLRVGRRVGPGQQELRRRQLRLHLGLRDVHQGVHAEQRQLQLLRGLVRVHPGEGQALRVHHHGVAREGGPGLEPKASPVKRFTESV